MTSSHKHVGLNAYAPEYFPSTYSYYVFFLPPSYPITLYNINNYQLTHLYYTHPTPPPPPPPTVAQPQASLISSHRKPASQEIVQGRRFGGACNKSRVEEKKGYLNIEREEIGNEKYRENGGAAAAACRVVQTCVMNRRRPKTIMPLRCGEQNVDGDATNITTIMIRNIPNKLTRNGLFKLLDKHCTLMNDACKDSGDQDYSAYDFVYLPIDFKTRVNKGYAFVNFTKTNAVEKFHDVFHNKAWDGFKTPKICEIVCAKIQGKEELAKHFGETIFICSCDEYLPVCFCPPRDGSGKAVDPLIVGNRSSHNFTEETKKKVKNSPYLRYGKACSGRVVELVEVTVGEHSSENLSED
ncbi:putative RNA recognition motif 2, nucleotide-binding alpha-beta plait domain-containing protein [Heracleum sosnowskyi]|uniref:RNA recognition motif 2, nucleotide-binding alpha-beta plait domain-containing protein n=1 Tax=Heracleum sosnowskyi TaxID=360622 RepID=A0AAD8JI64_9APIA|nr:putative RNA recognition motif 2, nucleotide-binding alpha-beta plait domain-containing protein [Heracleum sosnowskyi]